MQGQEQLQELAKKIDSLMLHGIKYYYKKYRNGDSAFFSGMLDAYYCFSYNVADCECFGPQTVQDAIDAAHEDIAYCTERYHQTKAMYYKGLIKGNRQIVDTLARFADNDSITVKHPYSVMTIEHFIHI